jgi:hypothetical protein
MRIASEAREQQEIDFHRGMRGPQGYQLLRPQLRLRGQVTDEQLEAAAIVTGRRTKAINGWRQYGAYDITTLTSAVKTAGARVAITT